jgi:hypothetical protein
VNYGFGYGGVGYGGGRWNGGNFNYNTAVVRVDTTAIHAAYIVPLGYLSLAEPDKSRPRRALCSKEEQCTKTQFKGSREDVNLYPVEVSVSYPDVCDVCDSKTPKHASAAIWSWRELPDLDGVIA